MSNKKIIRNEHLDLFSFKKPTKKNKKEQKSDEISYDIIGIDRDKGPYLCETTNVYKTDATYHKYKEIYSTAITSILDEGNMEQIHEYLIYNRHKWTAFTKWFDTLCFKIAQRTTLFSVVFEGERYLLVSWVPTSFESVAYPGYEKSVAVCGGREIDSNKILNEKLEFIYVANKMWYIDAGEPLEIIATSNKKNIEKLHAIMQHQKQHKSLQILQAALSKANTKLKLTKYRKPYSFTTYVGAVKLVWSDFLQNQLKRFDIKVSKNGQMRRWKMAYSIANCIWKSNFFSKVYFGCFDQDANIETTIFASNMKVSLSLESGRMCFRGWILKRENGNTFGTACLPSDCREEFSIMFLDLSETVQCFIFGFLECKDILICKNVCTEFAVMAIDILNAQ